MEVVNVIAIVASPLVAVLVTRYLQNRKEKRDNQLLLFATLVATRHSPITDEAVRALNTIDVIFHDKPSVRRLWREYYDMLSNEGLNNENGWKMRASKNVEMITEMARVLGYGSAITHLDTERSYIPIGVAEWNIMTSDITRELLRVLKASGGVHFVAPPSAAPPSPVTPASSRPNGA